MDKPVCKLCNKKHYSHEGHIFPEQFRKGTSDDVKNSLESGVIGKTRDSVRFVESEKKTFDRVAYQREYMRKRRAKSK